jgi:hypothetical protein
MIVNSGAGTGLFKTGMHGHKVEIVIELHGIVRSFEPERLMYEPERGGVIGLLELDMAVAVELDPAPGDHLDRHIRKGLQKSLLSFDKKG